MHNSLMLVWQFNIVSLYSGQLYIIQCYDTLSESCQALVSSLLLMSRFHVFSSFDPPLACFWIMITNSFILTSLTFCFDPETDWFSFFWANTRQDDFALAHVQAPPAPILSTWYPIKQLLSISPIPTFVARSPAASSERSVQQNMEINSGLITSLSLNVTDNNKINSNLKSNFISTRCICLILLTYC